MPAPTQPPDGALLVRVGLVGNGGLPSLPPVPAPHAVTLSIAASRRRTLVPADVELRGYRFVGTHAHDGSTAGAALLLVRASLLDAQPAFASELLGRAEAVFACDLGPVRSLFEGALAPHLAVPA